MYRPTELQHFLQDLGIRPKKGLSQNFLIDGNITRKIIQQAQIHPSDLVLEIGPGPGALTEALLNAGARVIAVEKDPILAQSLERLKKEEHHLQVLCADILDLPLEKTLRPFLSENHLAKVISNLPYHLTTPILQELITAHPLFSSLTLMVQEEVAQRFTATPGNKHYGSITLFLNYHAKAKYGFKVSNSCFYPKPKVNSAVVTFELRNPPKVSDEEKFFLMTRTAFEHRRKMLRASLKSLYPPETITKALIAIDQDPQARPETLSLNAFISLFEHLQL